MKHKLITFSLLGFVTMAPHLSAQTPLRTEFTYQGQLKASGLPALASADFQFLLFDALNGGTQIGSAQPKDNVALVSGAFTLSLDFGAGAFQNESRWIEVAVRSPAGAGGFTTLSPRQALTATPQALFAVKTPGIQVEAPEGELPHLGLGFEVGGGFSEVMRARFDGNVGIGTINPARPLHVRASEPALVLQDQGPSALQTGYIGFWNNDPTPTETAGLGFRVPGNPNFSILNNRTAGNISVNSGPGGSVILRTNFTALTVTADGDVGIGTSTPSAKLSVSGDAFITGSMGIGTAQSADKLHVNGSIRIDMVDSADNLKILDVSQNQIWGLGLNGLGNPLFRLVSPVTGDSLAGFYRENSSGNGVMFADEKNFRAPNPTDPATDIWYCCPEGPEAAIYVRGTARLTNGRAVIELPEHFGNLASEPGMTVQLTPRSSESKGLATSKVSLGGIYVTELFGGTGNYEFDWRVEAVRKGWEDYKVVRPWLQSDKDPDKAWQSRLKHIEERRAHGKPSPNVNSATPRPME